MVERIACFLTCGYTEADKLSRKSVESILKSGMRSYRACTRKEDQCKKGRIAGKVMSARQAWGMSLKRLDVNVCAPVPPCSVFNETKGSETMKN